MCPAKTAQPIEMPFGQLTQAGPRKHALNGFKIGCIRSQQRRVTIGDAAFSQNSSITCKHCTLTDSCRWRIPSCGESPMMCVRPLFWTPTSTLSNSTAPAAEAALATASVATGRVPLLTTARCRGGPRRTMRDDTHKGSANGGRFMVPPSQCSHVIKVSWRSAARHGDNERKTTTHMPAFALIAYTPNYKKTGFSFSLL